QSVRRMLESVWRSNRTFRRRKQNNNCQLNHLAYTWTANPPGKGLSMRSSTQADKDGSEPTPRAVQTVLDALQKLKFGAIQLTVHEGRLVQVDVTERHRYPN
ncbi:MAG: YezD family protein, partial [Sphingomonas sp.]